MFTQENLNNDLLVSAEKGDLNAVQKALKEGADINAVDKYHQTALMKAVLNKHEKISLFLIENGAEPDMQDCFKNTALMHTVFGAQKNVFYALLEKGASPHFEDARGDKVADLLYRVYQISPEEKKPLYAEMISEFIPDFVHREKQRALSFAIVNGNEAVVSLMIQEEEVNVNESDGTSVSPLQWAAAFNRQQAAFCLIESGANLDYQNKHGMTALMYAASNGLDEMASLLIESGADVSVKNKKGQTAAVIAFLNNHQSVFKMIQEAGTTPVSSAEKRVYLPQNERQKGE